MTTGHRPWRGGRENPHPGATLSVDFPDDQWAEFERELDQLSAEKQVNQLAAAAETYRSSGAPGGGKGPRANHAVGEHGRRATRIWRHPLQSRSRPAPRLAPPVRAAPRTRFEREPYDPPPRTCRPQLTGSGVEYSGLKCSAVDIPTRLQHPAE